MDWHWIIPIAITLGLATVGGIWALVQLVAKLVSEATAMKVRLDLVVPVAQEVPLVKQTLAVHEHRLNEQDEEIDGLREKAHTLSQLGPRKH